MPDPSTDDTVTDTAPAAVAHGVAEAEGTPGVVLTLFVADRTESALRAREQLQNWLDRHHGEGVVCRVVSVQGHPDLAEREGVLVTPALVRHSPPPRGKLVGDLADWEAALARAGPPDERA